MSLKTKNIILFAVLALIPILWITIVYNWNKGPFEKVSFEALNALRSTKKLQIKNHLLHQKTLLATSAETSTVQNALQDFNSAAQNLITRFEPTDPGIIKSHQSLSFWYRSVFLKTLDLVSKSKFNYESLVPNDPLSIYLQYHYLSLNPFNIWNFWKLEQSIIHDSYQKVHQKYHLKFRELKKRFNLQDIYLLNSSGRVLYTVNKSILFARSVHEIQSMAPELSSLFDQLKNNPTAGRVISVSFKPQISLFLEPISLFATSVLVDNDWGVLVFALDTSMLNQILYHTGKKSEEGLGKSGEIFVADADGGLISSSRPKIQNSWNLESLLENESQLEQWIGFERRYLSSPAVENALQGKSGTIKHETKLGSNLVSSYSPLKVDNFNWIIVVQKEMDEALWGSEIIFFQLLLAGIAFLFFTSAVQQVMTHIFLKPIAELSREAKRLSEGGEPSNFSPERKDEIGELQASFSNMSWNLFRIQKTLESQVQTCNLTANALQDSQTILEMVLGRIPSAIFWKDSNGHFLGANHSFCKLMGLPQSSIISDKDASVIEMNEWNQGLLEKIEHDFKNLGSKEYLSIENLQSSNGDLVLSTVLMLNLEDQSGNSKGVLGLIDDLSKKTRTQDDLVAEIGRAHV